MSATFPATLLATHHLFTTATPVPDQKTKKNRSKQVAAALGEWQDAEVRDGMAEVDRMSALFEHANRESVTLDTVCWSHCWGCKDYTGSLLSCVHCQRLFHPLCMDPPALTQGDLPDSHWACPCCGGTNQMATVRVLRGEGGGGMRTRACVQSGKGR